MTTEQPTPIRTINLEPTDEGYRNIASLYIESVLRDVRKARHADSAMLLRGLVTCSFYLATTDRAAEFKAHLESLCDSIGGQR